MIKGLDSVVLFSENPKELYEFYKEKVGLNFSVEAEIGEGEDLYGYEPKGSTGFYIVHHSEVHGKTKEPMRAMVNFEVDDLEAETKNLKEKGVKVITEPYHMEDYGFIATFEDPDGNYFQLVKVRE